MRSLLLSTIYPKELWERRIGGGFLLLLSHFISQRHKELLVRERPLRPKQPVPHRFISLLPAQLPPVRCPVMGEWLPLRSVKINRFEAFKACSQHLLPLTCKQARPANAPTQQHSFGDGYWDVWRATQNCDLHQNGFTTNSGWTAKGNTPVKGESQGGGEPRGAKSWAARGWFLLMLKLLPPSAAVAGILSQLGCRSHLGAHGDFSYFRGSGRAVCLVLDRTWRQEAWLISAVLLSSI